MFSIYNARMRKQTKNLRTSFALLLSCTTLFSCIYLSNMIYKNDYKDCDYDLDINNVIKDKESTRSVIPIQPEIIFEINKKINEGEFKADRFEISRINTGYENLCLHKDETNKELLRYILDNGLGYYFSQNENGEIVDFDPCHQTIVLNDFQYETLKPYIVDGDFENMKSNEVIIVHKEGDAFGEKFRETYQVGGCIEQFRGLVIKAYVILPDTNIPILKTKVTNTAYPEKYLNSFFIIPLETNMIDIQSYECTEHIFIYLNNDLEAGKVQKVLDDIIKENNSKYIYTNVALTIQTNTFTTFLIEILFYPLFFLLFISSLINIWHVLIGNIYLKRQDISILKTVGMTDKQLNKMFSFEYLEGYLGACALSMFILTLLSAALFGLAYLFDHYFQVHISMSLNISANLMGAIILSLVALGTILVIPLAILSLRSVKRIKPIEFRQNIS